MPDYDQIVVGMGDSAITFLYAQDHGLRPGLIKSEKTLVVGAGVDRWERGGARHSADRLGQNPDILRSLHVTEAPKSNLKYSPAPASATTREFQTIGAHNAEKAEMGRTVIAERDRAGNPLRFKSGAVTSIRKEGGFLRVDVSSDPAASYTATNVVVSTGPGSCRIPEQVKDSQVEGFAKLATSRGYRDIIDADSYLWSPQMDGLFVMVYGGSATAAWCVQRAMERNAKLILWVSRSGFLAANPAGRNSETIQAMIEKRRMIVGDVESIAVHEVSKGVQAEFREFLGADIPIPRLKIRLAASAGWTGPLADLTRANTRENVHQLVSTGAASTGTKAGDLRMAEDLGGHFLMMHQFVYATGQDPAIEAGALRIISPELKGELNAHFDQTRFGMTADPYTGVQSAKTVVALATPADRPYRLWIVGAAVHQSLGSRDLTGLTRGLDSQYKDMSNILCKENSPPEGVPLINQSMRALMGMTQEGSLSTFNWKVANLADIEAMLTKNHGPAIAAAAAGAAVMPAGLTRTIALDLANAQSATAEGFNAMHAELVLKATLIKHKVVALRPPPRP